MDPVRDKLTHFSIACGLSFKLQMPGVPSLSNILTVIEQTVFPLLSYITIKQLLIGMMEEAFIRNDN